jgi:uroporphyrinogen-III synthase
VERAPRPLALAMSKNKKSSESQPLKRVRVLVGRARHQAGVLSAQLREKGAQVIEIPFIEIRKPRSFKSLDEALKRLSTYDWLILTSVNGVDAMWARMEQKRITPPWRSAAPRAAKSVSPSRGALIRALRVAAIGPATRKSIEQRGLEVDVMPKEYVAESVVRSLKSKVKGKRVLLVRAKVARDVIPRELRRAGADVDVVEAYETVVPQGSRRKLRAVLRSVTTRPHVVTFTSSSTVKNFIALIGKNRANLGKIRMASIGPVTSATLRECGLRVDIAAREFTIPGLVDAIVDSLRRQPLPR